MFGIWALAALPAIAQERYALVIGNEAYSVGALRNPVNDARSMTAVLLQSGFETTLRENLTAAEFEAVLAEFIASVPEGAVGLFYYAGHAVQSGGRNFLLPVDIQPGAAETILGQSADAAQIIERFHAGGVEFGIFILDACRDNPFVAGTGEIGRGLASMESDVGETLIGFATQAGEVAYDGTGPNSPYTGALINEIDKEGKDILDVFRSVRRSVRIWTDGRQRPFISASIEREFTFREPTGRVRAQVAPGEITADNVLKIVERLWWDAIRDSRVPEDFRAFVTHFPNSTNVAQARNLAVELEETGQAVRGLTLAQFAVPEDRRAPQGLSAVITDCDIVAGDPDDPRRITDGVPWGLVNMRRALPDCAAALAEDPTNPRLLHQMGRILDIQGRYGEAEGFYRLAGAGGYSAALVNLGFLHVAAKGRERDYETALGYYRRAADLGNLRARTNIGEMFERGWFVEKNLDEAVLWYRLAAQNGWPNALDTLANLYRRGRDDQGRGVERDPEEAVRLYKVASELGNTNAMNNLGRIYLSDELGAPDIARGLDWMSRAAERGNRFAPFNLGRIYRDGKLVERDNATALRLFERSADLGFAPARIAIGRMYENGQGVEPSKAEAAFHFTLAAMTADSKRPRQEEEARERLAGLGLNQAELDIARQRAETWIRLNGG
ncbi:caspase family protein [Rhodovulum iodosum]|uniref:caspase family protein n=1 Tax=Rhodovulum iodosum TaxID=68291 RepID=UPI001B86873A|nr:caspase family protein [Rhodovulum robiginosum]